MTNWCRSPKQIFTIRYLQPSLDQPRMVRSQTVLLRRRMESCGQQSKLNRSPLWMPDNLSHFMSKVLLARSVNLFVLMKPITENNRTPNEDKWCDHSVYGAGNPWSLRPPFKSIDSLPNHRIQPEELNARDQCYLADYWPIGASLSDITTKFTFYI